jgi:hypothetical protein
MAGKAIGEYSLKAITGTYSPGPGGSMLGQWNWEGTATGFGAVFGTASFVGGPKGGSFSWAGESFLDNGDVTSAIGQGTVESIGKHRWRTEGFLQVSDGRRVFSEGEIDLASRSWKGKLSEMS